MTLGGLLGRRANSLNVLRLGLALCVVISHSWPLGGFGNDPVVGYELSLGSWAVVGFFAISGYLIPISRTRQQGYQYWVRRSSRIFPGLWVCLLVIAFVFAPMAALLSGTPYEWRSALDYILHNLIAQSGQRGIGTALDGLPSNFWNGSIWTVLYELFCYFVVGVLLTSSILRRHQLMLATVLYVGLLAVWNMTGLYLAWFMSFFAAGWLVGSLRERIRPSWAMVGAGALASLAMAWIPHAPFALPLALTLLCIGGLWTSGLFATNDVSYGVYIYAFPAQQILVLVGTHRFGLLAYLISSVLAALTLGTASWFLVERRFVRRARDGRTGVGVRLESHIGAKRAQRSSGRDAVSTEPGECLSAGASD